MVRFWTSTHLQAMARDYQVGKGEIEGGSYSSLAVLRFSPNHFAALGSALFDEQAVPKIQYLASGALGKAATATTYQRTGLSAWHPQATLTCGQATVTAHPTDAYRPGV